MKRTFLALAALACLALPAHANPFACYVGGSIGAAIASTKLEVPTVASLDGLSAPGHSLAVGAGCDYRLESNMVIGVLGQFDFGKMETTATWGPNSFSASVDRPWMIGGRLGVNVNPGTMVYGLIGYGGATLDLTDLGGDKDKLKGWTFGGGVEWMIPNGPFKAKLEYNYTDYRTHTVAGTPLDLNVDTHVVRLGVIYALGATPSK